MKYSRSDYRFAAVICLVGLFIVLVGLDVIPAEPESFQAPHWLVAFCGLLFFLAGASVLVSNYPRLRLAIVAILLAVFATIVAWMVFFAAAEGWSGGIAFLSQDINVWIARVLAGLGLIILIYAFVQVVGRLIRGDLKSSSSGNNSD